jgi:hypothetical protein
VREIRKCKSRIRHTTIDYVARVNDTPGGASSLSLIFIYHPNDMTIIRQRFSISSVIYLCIACATIRKLRSRKLLHNEKMSKLIFFVEPSYHAELLPNRNMLYTHNWGDGVHGGPPSASPVNRGAETLNAEGARQPTSTSTLHQQGSGRSFDRKIIFVCFRAKTGLNFNNK